MYFKNFGSARKGFFLAVERIQRPCFPLFLLSSMQAPSRLLEYPCPLNEPETHRQSIYIYPSASIGTHAFSAGRYSINHLPRSVLFKNTSPSSNRSISHAFLEETCMSLLLEIAQQICSFSRFSFVTLTYSIIITPYRYRTSKLQLQPDLTAERQSPHPSKLSYPICPDRSRGQVKSL